MIRPALRKRTAAVILFGCAVFPAGHALAEEPVETTIRGWISSLDATPNWVAGFGELSYDAATQTATIRNLSIRTENVTAIPGGKLEVTFDRIDVKGFNQSPDGAFAFQELDIHDARVVASGKPPVKAEVSTEGSAAVTSSPIRFDMRFGSLSYKDVSVPSFAGVVIDTAKPVASWIKVMSVALKASSGPSEGRNFVYDTEMQGEKTHTTIDAIQMSGMKDGVVDMVSMGPLTQETPSPDGLVKMKVEKIEGRGYNVNAIMDVLDPDRYVGGVGDGKWRTAVALETYRNWSFVIPGVEIRIGSFETENLRTRQPSKPFTPAIDQIIANPDMDEKALGALALDMVPDIIYSFGIGSSRLSDLDVVAPEIERFHLGDFHLTDFSSDGLGEIGVGDLDVAVGDKGSFGAERIAVGGFVFPSIDRIRSAIKAAESDIEVDPLTLAPTMGFAEAVNLDLVQGGKKLGALDRARLDLSDYIGPVPTNVGLDLRGLNLDLSLVDDPQARKLIEGLGYDRLMADYGFKLHWREADESLNLSDFKLTVKDVGTINADVALTGLKRATIEAPQTIESALPNLLFSRAKVTVQDSSVVDRAVAMEAKKKNQTPEKFREDVAGALPLTLMLVLKNPTFQQKLAPALQTFIRTPGKLTFTAAPATPVPLLAIIAAAESDPRTLPNLISLEVQAGQ